MCCAESAMCSIRLRILLPSIQGSVLRCSFYLAPALQSFLQSVDRVGQLTNLIASIDIGCDSRAAKIVDLLANDE